MLKKKVTGSQQGTVGLAKTVWSFIDLNIKKRQEVEILVCLENLCFTFVSNGPPWVTDGPPKPF